MAAALGICDLVPDLAPCWGLRPGLLGQRPSFRWHPKPSIFSALAQLTQTESKSQTCWTRALCSQMASSIRHAYCLSLASDGGAMEEKVTLQSSGLEDACAPWVPRGSSDTSTVCAWFWATLTARGRRVCGGLPPLLSPPSAPPLLGLHPACAYGCGLIILSVLGNSIGLAVNKGF